MTDLQVKYQMAQETARANRQQEELKGREMSVKELEANLKEQQVPYQIAKLVAESDLTYAQKEKVGQEMINLAAEVDKIKAQTELTQAEKETEILKAWHSEREKWKKESGLAWLDHWAEIYAGLVGSLFKGAGTALIG